MCCVIQSHIRTCVLHGVFDSLTYIDIFMCQHPQDLSILTDPQDKHSSKTSGQNTNAGWFNRYIQTGKSDHETKSNGCIGGMMCIYMHNFVFVVHPFSNLSVVYSSAVANHTESRGHGVGLVGSSWTGNLHPTPTIELLQGKRGDHGCMAKAVMHVLRICPSPHSNPLHM